MDQWGRYRVLSERVVNAREGLATTRQILSDFERNQNAATQTGNFVLIAQGTILALNIIINAVPVAGKAKSIYERLARALYEQYGASGTRVEGNAAALLDTIKRVLVEELTRKKMMDWIPVVRIFTGLSEDWMAIMQTLEMIERESSGTAALRNRLQRDVQKLRRNLNRLSHQQIQLLDRAATRGRTA